MKTSLALLFLFAGAFAQAAELTCWNVWSKRGEPPAFKAELKISNFLWNVQMIQDEGPFGKFNIADVVEETDGTVIDNNRSPYDGYQEFQLTPDRQIRLILPLDLTPDGLASSVLPGGHLPERLAQRQNGIIEVGGARHGSGGSIFIRMHCITKIK